MTSRVLSAPAEGRAGSQSDSRPTYSSPECDHVLRLSGFRRRPVYFELDDERSDTR